EVRRLGVVGVRCEERQLRHGAEPTAAHRQTAGPPPQRVGVPPGPVRSRSERADRLRLRALLSLADLELDLLVLLEGLESTALDGGVVDKDVSGAVLGRDEPVALLRVEPLDGALCHVCRVSFSVLHWCVTRDGHACRVVPVRLPGSGPRGASTGSSRPRDGRRENRSPEVVSTWDRTPPLTALRSRRDDVRTRAPGAPARPPPAGPLAPDARRGPARPCGAVRRVARVGAPAPGGCPA